MSRSCYGYKWDALIDLDARDHLKTTYTLVTIITPNLPEAEEIMAFSTMTGNAGRLILKESVLSLCHQRGHLKAVPRISFTGDYNLSGSLIQPVNLYWCTHGDYAESS